MLSACYFKKEKKTLPKYITQWFLVIKIQNLKERKWQIIEKWTTKHRLSVSVVDLKLNSSRR